MERTFPPSSYPSRLTDYIATVRALLRRHSVPSVKVKGSRGIEYIAKVTESLVHSVLVNGFLAVMMGSVQAKMAPAHFCLSHTRQLRAEIYPRIPRGLSSLSHAHP